jgi:hypothetical protein
MNLLKASSLFSLFSSLILALPKNQIDPPVNAAIDNGTFANPSVSGLVSTECGALFGEAYQQTLPEFLWDVQRSIAGSVTQFIIHRFPYSGTYGHTTWPGWTTFDYTISEMHGLR